MVYELREIHGFEHAMKGMRLSFGSASDSQTVPVTDENPFGFELGPKDDKLASRLVRESASASKFMRFIQVWLWIKAPRFWWQEFDTYKIGVDRLSESTMHTITKRPLTSEDFEGGMEQPILDILNLWIGEKEFLEVKKRLPESFLQGRLVICNYQSLSAMYKDRKNHKLPYWREFCEWIRDTMPHSDWITKPVIM